MSARHGWMRFVATGQPLRSRLTDDPRPWQEQVLAGHERWHGPDAPAQVSNAFVLQYTLQILAQTAAFAASVGMRIRHLPELTFERDETGVPRLVEIGDLERQDGGLDDRLGHAERDYRQAAEVLARAYRAARPMSSQQRLGMVDDMWAEAARAVRAGAGRFELTEPRRASCCLIYALAGCVPCAGCPRQAGQPQRR